MSNPDRRLTAAGSAPIRRPLPRLCLTLGLAAGLLLAGPSWAVLVDAPAMPAGSPPSAALAAPVPGSTHTEARIRAMHDRLRVTAAQEVPWRRVADVMREDAQIIDHLTEVRRSQAATLTAPEQLRSYGEITAAHAHGVAQLADAFDGLYAVLDPAQRLAADTLFRSRGHGAMLPGSGRKQPS